MPRPHTSASRGDQLSTRPSHRLPARAGAHRSPFWSRRAPRGAKQVVVAALVLGVGGLTTVTAAGIGEAAPRGAGPAVPATAAPQADARVDAAADAYVVQERPAKNYGSTPQLNAASYPNYHSTTYLRFDVKDIPAGAKVARATIVLTAPSARRVRLTVHPVDADWSESTLTHATAPEPSAALARSGLRGSLNADATLLTLDVTRAVQRDGSYSFAVRAEGDRTGSRPSARESGAAPVLELSWSTGAPTAAPSAPSGSPTPRPSMSPTPSGSPSATPTATPTTTGPARSGGTLFGASVWRNAGESYPSALARSDRDYGGLDLVRVFYPGAPAPWPGLAGIPDRPVSVSFKLPPAAVAAGAYDDQMLAWFRGAPADREIYWTYYHEPEDNVKAGEFSAAEYRAAWRRLASLADRAGKPRLRSTLVLMCFTLQKASGRNWQDYYPGSDVIDVMAWDCYSYLSKKGGYLPPENIFDDAVDLTRSLGKPFAITEFGSAVATGDNGAGRAAWLRQTGRYLESRGAVFAAYFDSPVNDEYRLLDAESKAAWREFAGR